MQSLLLRVIGCGFVGSLAGYEIFINLFVPSRDQWSPKIELSIKEYGLHLFMYGCFFTFGGFGIGAILGSIYFRTKK